jgi:hypothetical protein
MNGAPLVVALLERVYDSETESPTNRIRGNTKALGIEFTHLGSPRFRNRRGTGHFLCVFQSETKRKRLQVSVSEPDSAAKPWNELDIREVTWDQVIDIPVTQSAGRGAIMSLGTPNVMSRSIVANSHAVMSFLVSLDEDEDCILAVTGEADRQWSLMVLRLMPDGVATPHYEQRNLVRTVNPVGASSGWTRTQVNSSGSNVLGKRVIFWRVVNTSVDPFSVTWMQWFTIQAEFAHQTIVTIRKSANHSGGGTVRIRLFAGATEMESEVVTIPSDGSVQTVAYASIADALHVNEVRVDQLAPGTAFEIGVECFPVF